MLRADGKLDQGKIINGLRHLLTEHKPTRTTDVRDKLRYVSELIDWIDESLHLAQPTQNLGEIIRQAALEISRYYIYTRQQQNKALDPLFKALIICIDHESLCCQLRTEIVNLISDPHLRNAALCDAYYCGCGMVYSESPPTIAAEIFARLNQEFATHQPIFASIAQLLEINLRLLINDSAVNFTGFNYAFFYSMVTAFSNSDIKISIGCHFTVTIDRILTLNLAVNKSEQLELILVSCCKLAEECSATSEDYQLIKLRIESYITLSKYMLRQGNKQNAIDYFYAAYTYFISKFYNHNPGAIYDPEALELFFCELISHLAYIDPEFYSATRNSIYRLKEFFAQYPPQSVENPKTLPTQKKSRPRREKNRTANTTASIDVHQESKQDQKVKIILSQINEIKHLNFNKEIASLCGHCETYLATQDEQERAVLFDIITREFSTLQRNIQLHESTPRPPPVQLRTVRDRPPPRSKHRPAPQPQKPPPQKEFIPSITESSLSLFSHRPEQLIGTPSRSIAVPQSYQPT